MRVVESVIEPGAPELYSHEPLGHRGAQRAQRQNHGVLSFFIPADAGCAEVRRRMHMPVILWLWNLFARLARLNRKGEEN